MKKITSFFLFLLLIFTIAFQLGLWKEKNEGTSLAAETFSFSPAAHPIENRPFAVIVVSRNHGADIEKTLSSIFFQNYENYRLIYIDDASDDGSFDLARDCIFDSPAFAKTTIIQNETPEGPLASLFQAIQNCEKNEIVLYLQPGDFLAHEWVLQRLNSYYADPNLWLAWAKSLCFPNYEEGKGYDQTLHSFYAALFHKIQKSDLMQGGEFLKEGLELAIMSPMLEMAKEHSFEIPEVLTLHNLLSFRKQDLELQAQAEKYIRSISPYDPIETLEVFSCGESF